MANGPFGERTYFMKRGILTFTAAALALGVSSQAMAGGFNRGTADTDILFEQGDFNMRFGATIVAPQRDYETIDTNGVGAGGETDATDDVYSESYVIPSFAMKYQLADSLGCVGTYTTPFGSGAEYGPQAIAAGAAADGTGTVEEGFVSNEFGLTCGYDFQFANGHKLWFIGGAFVQDFQYEQTVQFANAPPVFGALANTRATLEFDGDFEPGYRAGIAYEIPEIAFRAQFLYRSEVEHTPDGMFTTASPSAPAVGFGTLPQSAELKLQSGIAAGTLAFVNVKWTDWSVLDTLDYTIVGLGAPLGGDKTLEYFWQDGWTVTGGIGRQFNDNVSGLVSLTWDRGVSTTDDAFFDTWTLALGGAFTDQWGGQLRGGVGLTYLEGGDVAADPTPATGGEGNSFAYSVGGDFSYAVSASYAIKW